MTAFRLADELATGSLVEYATADIVILTSTLLRRSVYFTGTVSSEVAQACLGCFLEACQRTCGQRRI